MLSGRNATDVREAGEDDDDEQDAKGDRKQKAE